MRFPLSWLADLVDLPDGLDADALASRLTMLDLKLEEIVRAGADVAGPLVVGRVLSAEPEEHSNGKTVNWCRVDVGPEHNEPGAPETGADGAALPPGRGIVCGAHNFGAGDLVVVSLPGTTLPGGFEIAARKTYGHVSDGMICSTAELGLGADGDGILVLEPDAARPGDDAIALLGLRDDVLDLEVNPDRAYALSLRGLARDTALGYDLAFADPASLDLAPASGPAYEVRVEAPESCPVLVARTVRGVDPSRPTPRWMSARLRHCGMRPISLLVDITNYVMLELGQPIHGYDEQRLRGAIVVRHARADERLTTLDGVVRDLDPDDLLICDDSGPIGIAGVMGGEHTELSATTTDVVIESAHFSPAGIARSARRHRLPSEASRRFERGVDPELPRAAAQRVADLLVDLAGGTLVDGETVVGRAPARTEIRVPVALTPRICGFDIDLATQVAALEANGCGVVVEADALVVTAPSWRPDLTDPYDVVEEVLRVVGYDRVPSVVPAAPAGRGLTVEQRLRRRVGYAMAGAGLVEVTTFPFAGSAVLDAMGLEDDDPRRDQVRIANPLSAEDPALTTTLLTGVLRAARRNVGRGADRVALFEIGSVFRDLPDASAPILPVDRRPTDDELAALDAALPHQPRHLATVLAGDHDPAGWWGASRPESWADAVETVRELARVLGVTVQVRAAAYAPWHPGRCAEVLLVGPRDGGADGAAGGAEPVVVGHAGELHPRVCAAFDLPARTSAVEVDLDAMIAAAPRQASGASISAYPVGKLDLAVVVRDGVPASEVEATIRAAGGALVEDVRLFDVYTGDQVADGHRSLAYALRLRAPDRTLEDADLARVRDAVVSALAADLDAHLR